MKNLFKEKLPLSSIEKIPPDGEQKNCGKLSDPLVK